MTSSGRSTERIVDELSSLNNTIEVVCGHNYTANKPYKVKIFNPNPLSPVLLFKIVGDFIGREISYLFWELRCKNHAVKQAQYFSPDVIISRGSPISSLKVGHDISKKLNIPHVIHFADPIPATNDWLKNKLSRKKMINSIAPIMKGAALMSFVTSEMCKYQLQTVLKHQNYTNTFICPNPLKPAKKFGPPTNDKVVFLYLGSLTIQRNPKLVLEEFIEFSKTVDNAELHIYGNKKNRTLIEKLGITSSMIKIFGETDNIDEVLASSNILLDIDPEFDTQVFVSGKLMEYLSSDRYILALSPKFSPSFNLFGHLKESIFFCELREGYISNAFLRMYALEWNSSKFIEREGLHDKYGTRAIINKIQSELDKVVLS